MSTRVVQDPPGSGNWISIHEWRRRQTVMKSARRPQSEQGSYDYTFRVASSEKLPWDFTQ